MTTPAQLRIAPDFALPLDAVTETIAVLGIRGSGKSTTAAVLVEELLARGQQVVIMDPTDVWWGLKSSADGTGPGYPVVVLGGQHGDLPLGAGDGKAIADFVVDHHASIVCALRHFESQAEMRRFVTEFCQRIYYRKGETARQTPLMLVIDEASLFVPQKVMGEETRMVSAIQRLVRQGRASGFGVTLIDQRASTVNKDVLTQLELLVAHRTSAPQDRKALEAWIDQHDAHGQRKEFLEHLASLPRGTAWFWSPGWLSVFRRVAVRAAATFDSRRTPKPGERVAPPTRTAPVDLEALKAQLQGSIERARAEDPKPLHARIRELEAALRREAAAAPATDPAAIERAVAAALESYYHEARAQADRRSLAAAELAAKVLTLTGEMQQAVRGLLALAQEEPPATRTPVSPRPAIVSPKASIVALGDPIVSPKAPIAATSAPLTRAEGLSASEQKVLDALALIEHAGAERTRVSLGFFAGYSEGGRFNNLLGRLRTLGLIAYPREGEVALTDAGAAAAHRDGAGIRTLAELHALWLAKLPPSEAKVLAALLEVHPRALAKEELGRRTNYAEGGRFNNILGRLRSLGAIDYPRPGTIVATDTLFPTGLR